MFWKSTAGASALTFSAILNAQQSEPAITMQQVLAARFNLVSVLATTAPCGNQPLNRSQSCSREIYFFQSPEKNMLVRCEVGLWNGRANTDCRRTG
jgi:hypothetical protein